MIRAILMNIKKRLYLYVAAVFAIALAAGNYVDFRTLHIKPISMFAVFLMLYPMLTGMEVEKVKKAGKDFKLILTTLFFAFFVASGTAYVISRTILASQPELAFAIVMVGAIPCSNMLIGWTGIADASVENAIVIAVIGLLLIPILSPLLMKLNGAAFVPVDTLAVLQNLLLYILLPLILGYYTRKFIIRKKGRPYFMELKQVFPGISATGILLIVFFSVAKVAQNVIHQPIVFLLVALGLFVYYVIQTVLSLFTARLLHFKYQQGMILILAATASSQAISLALAATMFSSMTVFALSFKPILQVIYIMFLIYGLGPWVKSFLGEEPQKARAGAPMEKMGMM